MFQILSFIASRENGQKITKPRRKWKENIVARYFSTTINKNAIYKGRASKFVKLLTSLLLAFWGIFNLQKRRIRSERMDSDVLVHLQWTKILEMYLPLHWLDRIVTVISLLEFQIIFKLHFSTYQRPIQYVHLRCFEKPITGYARPPID